VLPSKGAFGVGLGVMTMTMDKVKLGSNSVDPGDFIQRLGQKMEMYTMGGKKTVTTKNNGPSDTFVSYRYNLFKSAYYNHFVSLLAETSIPTGDFESKYISWPGLQTGTGNFTFGGACCTHIVMMIFGFIPWPAIPISSKIVTILSLVTKPGSGWRYIIPQYMILCSV